MDCPQRVSQGPASPTPQCGFQSSHYSATQVPRAAGYRRVGLCRARADGTAHSRPCTCWQLLSTEASEGNRKKCREPSVCKNKDLEKEGLGANLSTSQDSVVLINTELGSGTWRGQWWSRSESESGGACSQPLPHPPKGCQLVPRSGALHHAPALPNSSDLGLLLKIPSEALPWPAALSRPPTMAVIWAPPSHNPHQSPPHQRCRPLRVVGVFQRRSS